MVLLWPIIWWGQIPQITSKGIFNQLVDDCSTLGISQAMASSLDLMFFALSDPTRRQILTLLLEDDMAVTDVAEPFEMSLAAISKHLSVLTNARLIKQERRGRVKWCKLDPDAMQAAWAWMQGFGEFDPLDLDGLEAYIEKTLQDS
jgi:DNA-binding transcriptional ArsR family regulator